jgi:hypothetical protein
MVVGVDGASDAEVLRRVQVVVEQLLQRLDGG